MDNQYVKMTISLNLIGKPMPPRHPSTYSYRAKLGLIVPPTNTVNEAEWAQMVPKGVTFHTHRMRLHGPDEQPALMRDLKGAIAMLAQTGADAIAYACTAGSMTTPAHSMPDNLSDETGQTCLTTSAALIDALQHLDVKTLSVATPYSDQVNAHEAQFLADHGFDVLNIRGLGIGETGPQDFVRIARTELSDVAAHARQTFVAESDALLIACTDFPTLPLIAQLEDDLGVPVITSNQATLWAMLRAAGIEDRLDSCGKLLREH